MPTSVQTNLITYWRGLIGNAFNADIAKVKSDSKPGKLLVTYHTQIPGKTTHFSVGITKFDGVDDTGRTIATLVLQAKKYRALGIPVINHNDLAGAISWFWTIIQKEAPELLCF